MRHAIPNEAPTHLSGVKFHRHRRGIPEVDLRLLLAIHAPYRPFFAIHLRLITSYFHDTGLHIRPELFQLRSVLSPIARRARRTLGRWPDRPCYPTPPFSFLYTIHTSTPQPHPCCD